MTNLTRSTALDVDGNRYKLSSLYEPPAKPAENFSRIIDEILTNERENKESCKILAEKLAKIARKKARMTLELKAKLRKTYDLKLGNQNAEDELRRILANAAVAYAPILDPDFVLKTLGNVLNRQYAAVENGRRKLGELKGQLKGETTTTTTKHNGAPTAVDEPIKKEADEAAWKTVEGKGEKSGKILLEELIKIEKEWLKDLDAQLGSERSYDRITVTEVTDLGRREVSVLDETVQKLKDERDRLKKQLDELNQDAYDVHIQLHARKLGKENFEQKCNSLWDQLQQELSKDVDIRLTKNVFENYRVLRRKVRQPVVFYSVYRPPNISRSIYHMEKLDIELNRLNSAKNYVGPEKSNVPDALRLRCQGSEKSNNLEINQIAQNQLFAIKPQAPDVSDMRKGLERLRNVVHRHFAENDRMKGKISDKKEKIASQQLNLKFLLEKSTKILDMLLQKKRKLKEELDICLEKLKRLLSQKDEEKFLLETTRSRVAALKDQMRPLERKLRDFRKHASLLKRKSFELKAELSILVESLDRKKAINVQLSNLVQDMEKDAETREMRKKEENEEHPIVKSRKDNAGDMKAVKEAIQILEELDATRLPPAWLSSHADRIVAEGQKRIEREGLKPDQVQRSAIRMIEHQRATSKKVDKDETLEIEGPLDARNFGAKNSSTIRHD